MLRGPATRALCHLLCSPTLAVVGSTRGVIHVHAETPWTPLQAWGGPGASTYRKLVFVKGQECRDKLGIEYQTRTGKHTRATKVADHLPSAPSGFPIPDAWKDDRPVA